MALNIKSTETDRLVRELTNLTGESVADAVTRAVAERLERHRAAREAQSAKRARLRKIAQEARALPVLDNRSPDEILGYNELGHWD